MSIMIKIPSGFFKRGSSLSKDEQPVQKVYIDAFFIDKFPVSNCDFSRFILDGGYTDRSLWCDVGWPFVSDLEISRPAYWEDKYWNQPNQPVTGISWYEANAYARYIGKELPTEAQWEYAAKGEDGDRLYPWGNDEPNIKSFANFAPECEPIELERCSSIIGSHSNNISYFGCIDMAGNVGEWCMDNYSGNYEWDTTNNNPVYIDCSSDIYVTRGGSGLHDEFYMRCSSRDPYKATVRDNIVGFRCVKKITP